MKLARRITVLIGITCLLFLLDTYQNSLTPGDSSLHVAKAASSCSSVYTVQNLSSTEARYLHDFYDPASATHYYMEDTLPGGASKTYYLRGISAVPDGFTGTLTIGSNQPLSGQVVGLQCGQIVGEYFNNKTLSDSPIVVRDDTNIDFDWGLGSPNPAIPADNFSVRWTMTLSLSAGDYTFHTRTDDGVKLWVDGNLLIDQWHDMAASDYYGNIQLSAGDHTVKMEYYEAFGNAVAQLSWAPSAWRGEYYNNNSLSGAAALVRSDPSINFNWGAGSPDAAIPSDNFSVRWTSTLNLTEGDYIFDTWTDDGVRLWVDGNLIIDYWQHQPPTHHSSPLIHLTGGDHSIKMEYFEGLGGACASLSWARLTYGSTWTGQYYNNNSLSGSPTLTRNDATINFNWGTGSPDPSIQPDNFSVQWTSTLSLAEGLYIFDTWTDDGVRLWVDGNLIIDYWQHQPPTHHSSPLIHLTGGDHSIKMEYFEGLGGACASLSWARLT